MPSRTLSCSRCGEDYPLPEQLAPGMTLRVRCPACGHRFRLRLEPETEREAPAAPEIPAAPPPPAPEEEAGDLRRARRLARAIVTEMLEGNRRRRDRALAEGTLLLEFGEEIRRAWTLYQEKAGEDLARRTTYFRDALNEILADGRSLF